jgi:DNA-binding transcriptional LysR family regulator
MQLKDIDFNLVAVFDAIMTDRSVSRAAQRLGVSQSAVSHALARLRELTGDELFVRTQRGVTPTPEAIALAGPLRSAVDFVQIAFARKYGHNVGLEGRTYKLDLPVGFDVIVVPHLIVAAETFGINAQFKVSCDHADNVVPALRYGDTDIALDYEPAKLRSLVCQALYKDEFLVCARKGHPELMNGLTPETYLRSGHVTLNWARSPSGSPIDERLSAINIERRVLVSLPTLAGCASVAASTSLLFTIHARVAAVLASRFDLQVFPVPIPVTNLTIYMIWHERSRSDPGHRWLRRSLKQIAGRLSNVPYGRQLDRLEAE